MADYGILFSMGLLGGAHCLGMCGGFALIASGAGSRAKSRMAAYLTGKTVTYALMGAVLGAVGQQVMAYSGWQRGLSIAVGLFLIALGLATARVVPDRWLRIPDRIVGALGRLMARSRGSGPLILGLANGLIPCGLVYGALAQSITMGSWWEGAAGMALFGVGTAPALLLAGIVGNRVGAATRSRFARIGGWLVVLFGVWVVARTFMMAGRM